MIRIPLKENLLIIRHKTDCTLKKEGPMKYKYAILIFIVFIFIPCTTSSKIRLPPSSGGNGILVVPQSLKGISPPGFDFFYNYDLSYTPETKAKIEITPDRSKKFIIIKDFPPGRYYIQEIAIIPNPSGMMRTSNKKTTRRVSPSAFTIGPGKITILDRKMQVEVKQEYGSRYRQVFKLENLNATEREIIVKKIRKLKNFASWELLMGSAGVQETGTEGFKVTVTTDAVDASQFDIDRVKREAEHALSSISSFLGIEKGKTIEVRIVEGGIVRANGDLVYLPAMHVKRRKAAIASAITYLLIKPTGNRFFSAGLGVYFQERFGEDDGFPNMTGEPLDDLVRNYKDQLIPIHELANDNKIFRQAGTTKRKVAFIEAGSFIGFLVEMYGEEKMRELHDSASLDYSEIYGKNLKKLDIEWKEFVLK
jgi:hypothetical protein